MLPQGLYLTPRQEAIRSYYVLCRSEWGSEKQQKPVTYKVPKRYDGLMKKSRSMPGKAVRYRTTSEWVKIDKFCNQNEFDPEILIDVVFKGWRLANMPQAPNPDHIRGVKAKLLYQVNYEFMDEEINVAFASQMRACAEHKFYYQNVLNYAEEAAVLDFVLSPSTNCSALFRYAVLIQLGKPEIANDYKIAAIRQYRPYSDFYDRYWKDILPPDIRDVAKKSP